MANRFPLVIDTTDGNKLKELPGGDNLDLNQNSIVRVQNITSTGTIDAAVIRVAGNPLVAQTFAELSDTPSSYDDSENYFVKVNSAGTGLEFRPLGDIGNIEIDTITVDTAITPLTNNDADIGSNTSRFRTIWAETTRSDLVSFDGTTVFDATTGKIPYAALIGIPTQVSEFDNDLGYVTQNDLSQTVVDVFGGGATLGLDIQGSVFADDSTMIVDGTEGKVVGAIDNAITETLALTATTATITTASADTIVSLADQDLIIEGQNDQNIVIGENNTGRVILHNAEANRFGFGTGTGPGKLTSSTDIDIEVGNRVKVNSATPFRFGHVSTADKAIIVPQNGDVIYNTTDTNFEFYKDGEWIQLHEGTFTGDVVGDTTGTHTGDVIGNVTGNVTGNITGDVTASIFADDSTQLVDAVNGLLVGNVVTSSVVATSITGALDGNVTGDVTGDVTGNVTGNVTGDLTGNVTGDVTGNVTGNTTGYHTGDVTGSVFADDSTILVNGVLGNLNLDNNNTDDLSEGTTNLYYTDGRADARIAAASITDLSDADQTVRTTDNVDFNTVTAQFTGNLTGDVTGNVSGNVTGDVVGSVFADDSSIMVDAVNRKFIGNLEGTLKGDVTGDPTLTLQTPLENTGEIINISTGSGQGGFVNVTADNFRQFGDNIDFQATDSFEVGTTGTTVFTYRGNTSTNTFAGIYTLSASSIALEGSVSANNGITGDLTGSVFADDSTVLVDAINGEIPGYVKVADLKTALQDGAGDYAAFKAWVLANL